MDLVGIIITVVVAGIVFSVQEIRMKLVLQQQRRDLRKDFREEMKEALLENAKIVTSMIRGQRSADIDPGLQEKLADIAESTAASWFNGMGIPPAGSILVGDLGVEDIKPFFSGEDDDNDDDGGFSPAKKSK